MRWLVVLAALACLSCDRAVTSVPDFAAQRERMVTGANRGAWRDGRACARGHAQGAAGRICPGKSAREKLRDGPLPIGYDQTISQPLHRGVHDRAIAAATKDRVLEIGTGSGYQAAILAELVAEVYSIEIVEPLAKKAEATLQRLGYKNVHIEAGDGYKGWPKHAPFDAIIVTCAPDHVPQPLVDQLKEGGRMIIPVGGSSGEQELYLLEKKNGRLERRAVLPVRFVPMTGEAIKK